MTQAILIEGLTEAYCRVQRRYRYLQAHHADRIDLLCLLWRAGDAVLQDLREAGGEDVAQQARLAAVRGLGSAAEIDPSPSRGRVRARR